MLRGFRKDGRVDLRYLPKIVFRALGRHSVDGFAHQKLHEDAGGDRNPVREPLIEIDTAIEGTFGELETVVHEAIHLAFPWMFETVVGPGARYIARILWKVGFRRKTSEELD